MKSYFVLYPKSKIQILISASCLLVDITHGLNKTQHIFLGTVVLPFLFFCFKKLLIRDKALHLRKHIYFMFCSSLKAWTELVFVFTSCCEWDAVFLLLWAPLGYSRSSRSPINKNSTLRQQLWFIAPTKQSQELNNTLKHTHASTDGSRRCPEKIHKYRGFI